MLGLTSLVFFFALDLLEDEMSGVHPLQLLIRGLSWVVFVDDLQGGQGSLPKSAENQRPIAFRFAKAAQILGAGNSGMSNADCALLRDSAEIGELNIFSLLFCEVSLLLKFFSLLIF